MHRNPIESKINKGVPVPTRLLERYMKKTPRPKSTFVSPWLEFLKKLEIRDSFDTDYWQAGLVRTYAKKLGIGVVTQSYRETKDDGRIKSYLRVWRVE